MLSRELGERVLTAEDAAGVDRIAEASAAGADLNVFLHKSLRTKADKPDMQLNEWGIKHLHLAPGGSSALLFAWVEPAALYLVDVLDHSSFADATLIQILHDNWPELIAHGRAPAAVVGLEQVRTTAEREVLRSKHANSFTQVADGSVYMLIGGGTVGSGAGVRDVIAMNAMVRSLDSLEAHCRAKVDGIAREIRRSGKPVPSELELELVLNAVSLREVDDAIRDRWFVIREKRTGHLMSTK